MPEKYQRSARRLHASEQPEVKTRVKLFKGNGRWLTVLVFVVGAAMSVQGQTAQAATDSSAATQPESTKVVAQTATNQDTTAQQNTSTKVTAQTATNQDTTAQQNTSTKVTAQTAANQGATAQQKVPTKAVVSTEPASDASTVSTANTTTPSKVPTVSTTANDTTKTAVTKQVAKTDLGNASAEEVAATQQAKGAVYKATGQPQEITAQNPTSPNYVHVDKDNFKDYFQTNGSADYDSNTGVITLTPDDYSQDGNATLKNRIDLNQSFKLYGAVNLGDKAQQPGRNFADGVFGGGDGVAFAFHNGNTNQTGGNGAGVGIGGLNGAFGWKADTFFDVQDEPTGQYAKADPSEFLTNSKSDSQGALPYGVGSPYGSFIYTDPANGMVTAYDPIDDAAGKAQLINQPISNQFMPIAITYDGSSKIMTVNYDGKEWSHTITDWTNHPDAAFLISGGTGGAKNLQQFQILSFDYVTDASVNVEFVDEDNGNALIPNVSETPAYTNADGQSVPIGQKGDNYSTFSMGIPGYRYDGVVNGNENLPASGTLQDFGLNGTVIYGYKRDANVVAITPNNLYGNPNDLTVTDTAARTIEYVYADNDKLQIAPSKVQDVNFTRTEVLDGHTITYNNDWKLSDGQVPSVVSPYVSGYMPDQTIVPATSAIGPNDHLTVTVKYYKASAGVQTRTQVDQPTLSAIPFTVQPTDLNGNPIGSPIQWAGNPGTPIDFGNAPKILNYTLVPNQNQTVPDTPNSKTVPLKYYEVGLGTGNQIKTQVDEPSLSAIPFVVQPVDPSGNPIGKPIQMVGTPGDPVDLGGLPSISGHNLVPNQSLIVPGIPEHVVSVGYYVPSTPHQQENNETPAGPGTLNPDNNGDGPITSTGAGTATPTGVTTKGNNSKDGNDISTSTGKGTAPSGIAKQAKGSTNTSAGAGTATKENSAGQSGIVTGGDNGTAAGAEGGATVQGGSANATAANATAQDTSAGTAASAEGATVSGQASSNKQATAKSTLPQTNEDSTSGIATLGFLGVLASFFGLAGVKKRRKDL